MYIERHEHGWAPDEIQKRLNFYKEDLQDALNYVTKKPDNLSSLMRSALNYAGYLSVLEPNSAQLYRSLSIAANTVMSIFNLADLSITEEYDLYVGEGPAFSFPQTGPRSYSDSGRWQKGFYLAFACREKYVLESLVRKSTDIVRHPKASEGVNEYSHLIVDALKSFYNAAVEDSLEPYTTRGDTVKKLTAALKATDPSKVMESTIDGMLNLAVPEMEMIFRILEGDSEAFNASLAKALELHKKHWSSDEQMSGDPRGFIAIAPLGIACYAYDAGFPIEVESEYIPKYILEKQYRQQKKAS
jgi:hypothetical protein